MALPFILGLVVGAGAVLAFDKNDKIKETLQSGFDKTKEFAEFGLEKTKDMVDEVKCSMGTAGNCNKEENSRNETEKKSPISETEQKKKSDTCN